MLFIEYPKCSTCQKAKKWLESHKIEFTDRHIVEENPTKEELAEWISRSGLDIKRFFNTSGMKYRDLGLKDKLAAMAEEGQEPSEIGFLYLFLFCFAFMFSGPSLFLKFPEIHNSDWAEILTRFLTEY